MRNFWLIVGTTSRVNVKHSVEFWFVKRKWKNSQALVLATCGIGFAPGLTMLPHANAVESTIEVVVATYGISASSRVSKWATSATATLSRKDSAPVTR